MPERENYLPRVRALYEDYLDRVCELERNRKPGAGIFGLKGGPKDDPCHDRFAEELEKLLAEFAASDPGSEEIRAVLSYMHELPPMHREPRSAYWMLIAVHGLGLELTEGLSREDAAALRSRYARLYPRWERLPAQKKLLAALKK